MLFTDGEDNSSWFDAGQLRRVLEESNVLLQTVGVVPAEPRTVPDTPHVRLLRQLAEVTGGRFWPAASPGGLASAFVAILEAMKTRYLLRFEPAQGAPEGRHELDVGWSAAAEKSTVARPTTSRRRPRRPDARASRGA